MPTDVGIKHVTSIYATLVLQKVICTDLHSSIKEKNAKIKKKTKKIEHKVVWIGLKGGTQRVSKIWDLDNIMETKRKKQL